MGDWIEQELYTNTTIREAMAAKNKIIAVACELITILTAYVFGAIKYILILKSCNHIRPFSTGLSIYLIIYI